MTVSGAIENVVKFFEKLGKVTSVVANIVVILALVIAYRQLNQTQRIDEKRVAIEAIRTSKDQTFLKSFAHLKTFSKHTGKNYSDMLLKLYETKEYSKALSFMTDDINYILSYYNYISMLFDKKIADQNILKTGSYVEAREFSKILDKVSDLPEFVWVLQGRRDFDCFLMELIRLDYSTYNTSSTPVEIPLCMK